MAMSTSSKSPGRTPPFVLVALVLLVVILGYNYWVMSSSNRALRDTNDKMILESKDTADKRLAAEKNLESAREELRIMEGNLAQVKKSLQEKDVELNNIRADQNKAVEDNNKCKDSLAKCDQDLQTEKRNVETLQVEKTKLEGELAASKEKVCGPESCIKPVKDILIIATKLVGTEKMTQTLTDAKLDATKLMEGIEKMAAPAIQTDKTAQVNKENDTSHSEVKITEEKNVAKATDMTNEKEAVSPNEVQRTPSSTLSAEAKSLGEEPKKELKKEAIAK